MSLTLNPEQEAAATSPGGYCMISANAGTGKTETCAEYIVRKYLQEERRAFPSGRATGKEQLDLLRQFTVITFTNKAATELDHRIRQKFKARGIPVPASSVKLCRTLDGLLQRWFFNPLFMQRLVKLYPRWEQSAQAWMDRLRRHKDFREYSSGYGSPVDLACAWLQKWGLLLSPKRAALLVDLALGLPSPVTEDIIGSKLETGLLNSDLLRGRNHTLPVWEELEAYKDRDKRDKQYYTNHSEDSAKIQEIQDHDLLHKEFVAAYDLARSYGYHPVESPQRLGHQNILEHLSCNKQLVTLTHLHQAALTYERLKLKFLAMDFGDFMWYIQSVFGKDPALLEPGVEYPKLGFRSHWIIWDEAQDGGLYQYIILNYLCNTGGAGFGALVVGDVKQSIYQWRGAQPHEFVKVATHLATRFPGNIFYLTCSYRSSQQVVALGNEISSKLPSYGDSVQPSSTVYKSQGSVAVLAPVDTYEQEAEMVLGLYRGLRSQFGPDLSIFIVWRKDGWRHPLQGQIPKDDHNLRYLSIHEAKGLEADVVIILTCNAGVIPNPGSEEDQEANLFYVAATRARSHVFVSCSREFIDTDGRRQKTGPSPYLSRIPMLKKAAGTAGWSSNELQRGVQMHMHLDSQVKRGYDEANSRMQEECKVLGIKYLSNKLPVAPAYEHTGLPPRPVIQTIPQPPLTPFFQEELDPRLQQLLEKIAPHFGQGRLPELTTNEFRMGFQAGWWTKEQGKWTYTTKLAGLLPKQKKSE